MDSIRRQVLVLAVAAAVVPALTILVVSSRQSRGSRGDQVARELRGLSSEAAWDIGQWLDGRLYDLRVAASSYTVSENLTRVQGRAGAAALARLRDYLNAVRERSVDCDALVLLDAHGRVVAGSGGRMSAVQFSLDKLNGLRTGEALIGDAYWDTGLSKAAVTLAVPVRDADGRFLGAGFWGGQCPSLAHYVTGMGPMDGATAAGGRSCCLPSHLGLRKLYGRLGSSRRRTSTSRPRRLSTVSWTCSSGWSRWRRSRTSP